MQSHPPAGMRTRVVAIDGQGGAGKTTLARAVAEALGDAPVVHTDFASPEDPKDWWRRLLADVLCPLSQGRAGRYRPYDWVAGRLTGGASSSLARSSCSRACRRRATCSGPSCA